MPENRQHAPRNCRISHACALARPLQSARVMKTTTLVGRILFSLIFIFAAIGHFKPEEIAYAAAAGVPLAKLAVPASGLLSLAGGLSIALGYRAKLGGWAIVVFLVPVTLMMHNFWSAADAATFQRELMLFARNLGLLAGALQVGHSGAGALSLDALMADALVTEPVAELDYVA